MNTDTGKVYEGEEVDKARSRGEKLVEITAKAAKSIKEGRRLLAIEKRKRRVAADRAAKRRSAPRAAAKRRQQKASRRANRR